MCENSLKQTKKRQKDTEKKKNADKRKKRNSICIHIYIHKYIHTTTTTTTIFSVHEKYVNMCSILFFFHVDDMSFSLCPFFSFSPLMILLSSSFSSSLFILDSSLCLSHQFEDILLLSSSS